MPTTPDQKKETSHDHDAPRKMIDKAPISPTSDSHDAMAPGHETDAQLPHERDQSIGGDSTGGMGDGAAGDNQRAVIGQAHADLQQGQVDTDLRATPGLDAEQRGRMVDDPKRGANADPSSNSGKPPRR